MKYDVFLSFLGKPTRTNFTSYLYDSLRKSRYKIFVDDEKLKRGAEIAPSLAKAIDESKIIIIVLYENFATLNFCLDELAKILDCVKGKDQFVLPVFYHVDPSGMPHPREVFKDALAKYEERFKDHKDKLLKWRSALHKAANLSGFQFKSGHEYEHELVGNIAEMVSRRINHPTLRISNHPVGLEARVLEVISLLGLDSDYSVNMVGIWGIGGIGKSTIARAVYNSIADQFEGTYFLADVRENSIKHGLVHLQNTLLGEVVGDKNINVGDVCRGIPIIKMRLQRKKILLVLDDVDRLEQLFMIAGGKDWFGNGSRIIITTRDKHLLECHSVDRMYEVKRLNHKESLELFSWNAFKSHEVDPSFLLISNRIVQYAGGFPLALEVMGSNLFGKGINKWSSTLYAYESIPNKDLYKILKVSYDDLDEEEKEIFLDIACVWKGQSLETVKNMLDACGFHSQLSIDVLIEKSLLKIDGINCVTMHDLIQDMGKEIVRQRSTKDVGKPSKSWFYHDTESRSSTSDTFVQDMGKEIVWQLSTKDVGKPNRSWFYHDTESRSSTSNTIGWAYDVYLSFRGKDTRNSFVAHLYNSLCLRGIKTFIDDECLKPGDEITKSLLKAFRESRIAIVVFSQNYASSTYCLDELVNILECFKGKGRLICPIFYNVNPSDIRHCRGVFKDVFAKHEKRFEDKEKVLKWRLALREVANMSGWHLNTRSQNEHEFLRKVVNIVSQKINCPPLHIANHPVGLELPVLEIISLLALGPNDRVKMVGIYGIGGIGKSTIARAVYNYIANQFEGTCFLANVGENSIKHGLVQLQKTLLGEVVGERNINVRDVHTGIQLIKRRLQQRKILLILDGVNRPEELEKIAGGSDWFGCGSRIIITTRNKHLLACRDVDIIYKVQKLNQEKALELFSWNAFKNHEVDPKFQEISNRFVFYADGLPLALEVLGSNLFRKGLDEWSSALYKNESMLNKHIYKVLKVSYDGLNEEEKGIFLDIACCFNGESLKTITSILEACYFNPKYSIKLLVDKSLLEIDNKNCVTMHGLIQQMGKEIVRQQSTTDVSKRSRLWSSEDIIHILENNKGSDKIEVIVLDPPKEKGVHWNGKTFKKMKNLRILIIRNTHFSRGPKHLPNSLRVLEWWAYPSPSLPCDFHAQKLAILKLQSGCFIQRMPYKYKMFECLTSMDCTNCDSLRQIPDLSGVPNLMELCLNYCTNLIRIDDSVGVLSKLQTLSAYKCINLTIFPSLVRFPSLERLVLSHCASFQYLPEILYLGGSRNPNQGPSNLLMSRRVESFQAMSCKRFPYFDSGEGQEEAEVCSLRDVNLSHCNLKDDILTAITSFLYHVVILNLSGNSFTVLPASFKECHSLRELCLDNCKWLREIKGIPPNIECFSARNCTFLSSQSSNTLLRQAILETNGNKKFILPGAQAPEWFDYTSNSASLTFWFRKKFPVVAYCIILEEQSSSQDSKFVVWINGTPQLYGNLFFGSRLVTKHVFLYGQQVALLGEERHFLEHDWNRVDVLQWTPNEEKNIVKVKGIAVNINRHETSMEDILFEDPYVRKRSYEEVCYRGDLDLNRLPPQKKQCIMLGTGVRETLDAQEQQLSTLTNAMTPLGNKIMAKHTKNNFDEMYWDSSSNISVSHRDTFVGRGTEESESTYKAKGKSITARSNILKKKRQEWLSVTWSSCRPEDKAWDFNDGGVN